MIHNSEKTTKLKKILRDIGLIVFGVILGLFVTKIVYSNQFSNLSKEIYPIRDDSAEFKFIEPLLGYNLPEAQELGEQTDLDVLAANIIEEQKAKGNIKEASVYYRDFSTGRWTGFNEDEGYSPASLMKVFIMVAYFKAAESNPSILNKELTYQGVTQTDNYSTPSQLQSGQNYKTSQLIGAMIIDSDNGATEILKKELGNNSIIDVLEDFDIFNFTANPENDEISVKSYSLVLRALYNATYLNRKMSELALELLSRTNFKDGLVAGIPEGTLISHKYGFHVQTQNNTPVGLELHDCGIVYHPNHPYLLCVMTRGNNFDSVKEAIKSVSREIYNAVGKHIE